MKLPPVVKQLLTLRNPNPILNPTSEQLRHAFEVTSKKAEEHNSSRGWLVLSTSTALGCNSPVSVGHLYRYATRTLAFSELHKRVELAALMRESALKGSVFVGVAMTINAMASLTEALEPEVKEQLRTVPLRPLTLSNVDATLERGQLLWRSIYEPHADKLQKKLGSYHPDFPLFILQAYGSVLSPGAATDQGNLNRTETSLVGIATLRALEGVGPQLISHVYGLMKARGLEGQTDADAWLSSEEGTEWAINTVDKISDAIRDNTRSKL